MTNQERSQIVQQAKANGYQGSYVDLFKQAAANPNEKLFAASSPMQKAEGLRPHHEAGMTDSSMVFEDMGPNTSFNTMGLKAPINIDKYDDKGHLVKSYDSVPPGIQDLDMGPNRGTVVETPARMQEGGFASDNTSVSMPKLQDQEAFNPYSDLHLPPSGRVEYSGANVEDLLGIGSLLKAPVKAAAKNTKAALKNTYKINPFANKLNNPNAHYRVVHGRAALDDALQSGVIRSGSRGGTPGYNLPKGFDDIRRTGFPSFSKGSPVMNYGKGKSSQTVFENSKGIFAKAGQPNPVTGKIIKSRHGAAHRPIDPKTGNVLSEIPVEKIFDANNPHWLKGFRQIKQTGGYNPGEYMNKMEPRVFPNQKRDAKWVKYAEDHDFAGRFPGETRTNKEIGLQRSNRNTVPLPTTSVRPKEIKKMQGGFFNIDSKGQDILSGRRPKRRKRAQSGAGVETQPGRIAEGLPTFEDLGGWDGVMENAPDFLLSPFATVRERLAENIKPLGYGEDPAQRVLDAVWNNKPEKYSEGWTEEEGKRDDRDDYMRERTDFLAMTMGQDQPYSTVKKSEYAPSKGSWFDKITGKDYYVSPTTEKWIQGKIKRGGADRLIAQIEKNRDPETNVSSKYWTSGGKDNTLGNYTLDVGEDEKGRYISYHDQWDLNPFSGTMLGDNTFVKMGENALQSLLGVDPPEIYGRIYIDDKKSKKSRKGGFRPSGRRRSGI